MMCNSSTIVAGSFILVASIPYGLHGYSYRFARIPHHSNMFTYDLEGFRIMCNTDDPTAHPEFSVDIQSLVLPNDQI